MVIEQRRIYFEADNYIYNYRAVKWAGRCSFLQMEPSIEQLEAGISSWRIDVKVLLMERKCWRIVTRTGIKPEEAKCKEYRDFNSRKDKADSKIYLNISKIIDA
ncbi:hypothetical protein AVEN_83741-1 [Araneus ventricosus]|uniref:Uncharacterized protein n=1 Tax=Araneus ventricosus TaxID=182803 RepID=A0A4Y2EY02_ARAVE|nr:hypothetical protein AVEN_83741-1 [Araneus ventricosus]